MQPWRSWVVGCMDQVFHSPGSSRAGILKFSHSGLSMGEDLLPLPIQNMISVLPQVARLHQTRQSSKAGKGEANPPGSLSEKLGL